MASGGVATLGLVTARFQLKREHPQRRRRVVRQCGGVAPRATGRPEGATPGRLDEGAARERVLQLASSTPQGQGALEAVRGRGDGSGFRVWG